MLDPKSLSVAVAVAELGSVTRAAHRLHMSQPAVSYHLRKLAATVRAPLFQRGVAGLVPTPEGEALVSRARPLLAELGGLERDIRGLASGEGATVRMSSACFTTYHWLPEVLCAFRERRGAVRVELDVDPSRRPFEQLDRGVLDLALTTIPPEGSAFTSYELFEDEIVAVMRPDHPLAEQRYLRPADFADQSVVVFDRSQSDLFNLALIPAGVTPRQVMEVPVTEALLELVRSGVAITAMASWVAQPDLELGRLRGVRIGRRGLHRTWAAVVSARRPVPAHVEAFLGILREKCVRNGAAGAVAAVGRR